MQETSFQRYRILHDYGAPKNPRSFFLFTHYTNLKLAVGKVKSDKKRLKLAKQTDLLVTFQPVYGSIGGIFCEKMTEITIPLKLEELLQADSGFQVISEWNPCDLVDEEIQGHIEDLVSLTQSEGGLDQLNQETIDALFSLVTNFTALSDENKELFVEGLTELTTAAVATIVDNLSPTARNARKQLVFFLVSFIQANEQMERDESADNSDKPKPTKTKGKKSSKESSSSSFSWVEWRHACMKIVYDALCSEPSHLWSMGLVGENYLFGM